MGENRYYTAREIDALIPQLEHIFEHIETCRARAEELAAQALRPSKSSAPSDVAQVQLLQSQIEFLIKAVEADVEQIKSLGGMTKDLDAGLVDFLGDVGGHDVWLCWRRGEKKVRFWHPLDGGYKQRRALAPTRSQSRPN
jgi:hypothetical protein